VGGGIGQEAVRRITPDHVERWRRDGYVVVEEFLRPAELEAIQSDVLAYLPTWEEFARDPERYRHLTDRLHFPEFPYEGLALNFAPLHPEVMAFVEEALGTSELFVTMSHLWGKYAGTFDFEQPLHRDYHNNTLVVPRSDGVFRQIPFMLYLTDVDLDLSPTYVVSHGDAAHVPPLQAFFPRDANPELYEREHPLVAPAGSLLIYDVTTIHRGSAMTASAGARWTHHFVYRTAGLEWMGWAGWPKVASGPHLHRVIEAATPAQRSLLGFPRPGDPYWNDETLAGVACRYPGIDMAPYVDAMAGRGST
jgi:hypothetical protein